MNNVKALFSLCLLLWLAGTTAHAAETDWELVKDKQGIQVYTRNVEGSPIKAFRGEIEIDTDLNRVLGVLDDAPGFVEWMHNCRQSIELSREDYLDRLQYMAIDFPWPTDDRDMIVRNRISYDLDNQHVRIALLAVAEEELQPGIQSRVPAGKGRRRVSDMVGFFDLKGLAGERTKVVYQLHLDPAGAVPAGIVNAMIVDNPFGSLKGLRAQAKLDKYREFAPLPNLSVQAVTPSRGVAPQSH